MFLFKNSPMTSKGAQKVAKQPVSNDFFLENCGILK
jgi:hypothetical protein